MKKSTIRQNKYDKDNTVRYSIKLNTTTDSDIIQKIEDISKISNLSKQGIIKQLMRFGMSIPITSIYPRITTPVTTQKRKDLEK